MKYFIRMVSLMVLCFDVAMGLLHQRRWTRPTTIIVKLGLSKAMPLPTYIHPEFSRVINIAQIPTTNGAHCRLLASQKEREALGKRFHIDDDLLFFSVNMTLLRTKTTTVLVNGTLIAHVLSEFDKNLNVIKADFETKLLCNNNDATSLSALRFADEEEFDDEVGPTGDIDIGEIAANYLSLEL